MRILIQVLLETVRFNGINFIRANKFKEEVFMLVMWSVDKGYCEVYMCSVVLWYVTSVFSCDWECK